MCTAMILESESKELFFGRTMDFPHDISPQIHNIPNSYEWINCSNQRLIKNIYRIIGLGQKHDNIFGLFDGINEKGLAGAALYFPGYTQYDTLSYNNYNIAISSIDFLLYILGACASVKELPIIVKNISIVGMSDPVTNTIAPLHWIIADKKRNLIGSIAS